MSAGLALSDHRSHPITGVIGAPATVNRYPYAGDDPSNLTDYAGLSLLGDIVKAGVSFAAGAVLGGAGAELGPVGAAIGGCVGGALGTYVAGGVINEPATNNELITGCFAGAVGAAVFG
ncbi:MAG: hypothetical protein NVS3B12_15340 [Acidimicrobiales bacterium]